MSVEAALTLIVLALLGLGGLLVKHMLDCRDTRLDIAKIKTALKMEDER